MKKFVCRKPTYLKILEFGTEFPKQAVDFCALEDYELARQVNYLKATVFEPLVYFRFTALKLNLAKNIEKVLGDGKDLTGVLLSPDSFFTKIILCDTFILKEIYTGPDITTPAKASSLTPLPSHQLVKSKWIVSAMPKRDTNFNPTAVSYQN